jgi:hypothetical protein
VQARLVSVVFLPQNFITKQSMYNYKEEKENLPIYKANQKPTLFKVE